MAISIEDIKKLREITGAGLVECKEALEAADGDLEAAVAQLGKKKGQDLEAVEALDAFVRSTWFSGDVDAARGYLDEHPDYVNARVLGEPVLCKAAYRGHGAVVRLLVERGADVNALDTDGDTPLANAIMGAHSGKSSWEIADYLSSVGGVAGALVMDMYRRHMDTLKAPAADPPAPGRTKSGCFIATACYGDYDHPDVLVFRRFRDERLLPRALGRAAVSTYYAVSPTLAAGIKRVPWLAAGIRRQLLEPLARALR